jgi:hypothetical protein
MVRVKSSSRTWFEVGKAQVRRIPSRWLQVLVAVSLQGECRRHRALAMTPRNSRSTALATLVVENGRNNITSPWDAPSCTMVPCDGRFWPRSSRFLVALDA